MKSAVSWMTMQLSSVWWFSKSTCLSFDTLLSMAPMLTASGEEISWRIMYWKGLFILSSEIKHIWLDRISHVVSSDWKEAGSGCLYGQAQKSDTVCDEPTASSWPHCFIIFLDLPCLLDSLNMPRAYRAFYSLCTFPENSQKILLVRYSVPWNAWSPCKTPAPMLPSLKPSLSPLEKLVIPSFVTQSTRPCNVRHLYYFFLALRVFLTSLCVLRWVGRDNFLFYPDIYFPDF